MKRSFINILIFFLSTPSFSTANPGDVNFDGSINLKDVILALEIISGTSPPEIGSLNGDVNGDAQIGLPEANYALTTIRDTIPPSFPINWPFPKNTDIHGIVYFDHNQQYNFDPFYNDNNGAILTYFCKAPASVPYFTSKYGDKGEFLVGITDGHRGNDFFIPQGTPILAAADGIVFIETGDPIKEDRIRIEHDNGWVTLYAHSIVRDTSLHNQQVIAGEQIGYINNTGTGGIFTTNSTDYYELHFEVYRPNMQNNSGFSSIDPYYGDCSDTIANPEQQTYWIDGVPLNFIPDYDS